MRFTCGVAPVPRTAGAAASSRAAPSLSCQSNTPHAWTPNARRTPLRPRTQPASTLPRCRSECVWAANWCPTLVTHTLTVEEMKLWCHCSHVTSCCYINSQWRLEAAANHMLGSGHTPHARVSVRYAAHSTSPASSATGQRLREHTATTTHDLQDQLKEMLGPNNRSHGLKGTFRWRSCEVFLSTVGLNVAGLYETH